MSQQRGWGQHLVLAGLEGGEKCRALWLYHCGGHTALQLLPCSSPSGLLDTSFSTGCVDGVHPMGSYACAGIFTYL